MGCAVPILTMPILTMAILTMAVLTVAILTMAGAGDGGTVPSQGARWAGTEADGARAIYTDTCLSPAPTLAQHQPHTSLALGLAPRSNPQPDPNPQSPSLLT